jgi:hypothetical protein
VATITCCGSSNDALVKSLSVESFLISASHVLYISTDCTAHVDCLHYTIYISLVQQLLEALAAAFAACTVPDHTDDTPTTTATTSATSVTAARSNDDRSTDVAANSSSSANSSSATAKHSADAPIVTVKPEKAKVRPLFIANFTAC